MSEQSLVRLSHLKTLAQRTKTLSDLALKSISVSGNTVNFFKTADASGTADYTLDFPAEYFLDQTKTVLVDNFTWSSTTYPGSTDPNLNGKPVLVLALKGENPASTTYSFLNMAALVDTYTVATGDSQKILTISGRTISFKISAADGNIITAKTDGLYATTRVAGAANGNVTSFDANGTPVDSGIAKENVLQVSNIALDTEVAEMITEVFD